MAAIFTLGWARAARAWVCVMLPEPIRPIWVVMGDDRMIRNFSGEGAREVSRQAQRHFKWVKVRSFRGCVAGLPSLRDSVFIWRVPRPSSWAKFFDVPPGLVMRTIMDSKEEFG